MQQLNLIFKELEDVAVKQELEKRRRVLGIKRKLPSEYAGKNIIYTLADPRDGCVRYVGKTNNMGERYYGHILDKYNNKKSRWIRSLELQGVYPSIEALEILEPDDDWQEAERFWVENLRFLGCRLLNMDSGGNGSKVVSLESRLKMSESHKGKTLPRDVVEKQRALRMGHPVSLETRRKISIAHLGKTMSLESRLKMGARQKGKRLSPETIAKIAKANTGKKRSKEFCEALAARMRVRPVKESTRAKFRIVHKGRRHTAEAKAKVGNFWRGKPKTEEQKRKMRESALRWRAAKRNNTPVPPDAVVTRLPNGGIRVENIRK